MAIVESDIAFYRSATVDDTSSNGGIMNVSAEAVDGTKNNVFGDASLAYRTTGGTAFRKIFAKNENAEDLALINAHAYLRRGSVGDDWTTMFPGTQDDTQGDISSPREYYSAPLASNLSAGATVITCTLEDSSLSGTFVTGDTIVIEDDTNYEKFENVTIAVDGVTLTITLDSGDALANSYDALDGGSAQLTWVASVYEMSSPADLEPSTSDWTETSASGTYDESGSPLGLGNVGTVEDDWTITLTSATEFGVAGVNSGSLASGAITGDYSPSNPDGGEYFTLLAAGWAGTWASGDTVTFSTHPSAMPLWLKRVVPAGAGASSVANPRIILGGESE